MGLWREVGLSRGLGVGRDESEQETAIAAVGLTGFETRPIGSLSGGQMQRALFARPPSTGWKTSPPRRAFYGN